MSNAGKIIRIKQLDAAASCFSQEVCDTLCGRTFVCIDPLGRVPTPIAGGSGTATAPIDGYHVDQRVLIAAVRARNVEAGLWLAEYYPQPDGVFTFLPHQVTVL